MRMGIPGEARSLRNLVEHGSHGSTLKSNAITAASAVKMGWMNCMVKLVVREKSKRRKRRSRGRQHPGQGFPGFAGFAGFGRVAALPRFCDTDSRDPALGLVSHPDRPAFSLLLGHSLPCEDWILASMGAHGLPDCS